MDTDTPNPLTASAWIELAGKSIGGRSPSLRWPHLFDILIRKGYSQEKAARISNAKIGTRKDGKLKGVTRRSADRYRQKHNL